MQLNIENEYNRLEAVLVHRPGTEIDRLNYHNMRRYLFEDIPYLKRMQQEHDEFVGVMKNNGVEVVYLEALLKELIDTDAQARSELISEVCTAEGRPEFIDTLFNNGISNEEVINILFGGLTEREFKSIQGHPINNGDGVLEFAMPPIPNAYFSRDPAVVVKDSLISSKMQYPERIRESILTRTILEKHPKFHEKEVVYGGSDAPEEDRTHPVEGGDVLILNSDALIIGASERTSRRAIERIAINAFGSGHMKRVYEVTIPIHRDYMHLDTIFTVVDRGTVVWYPQVMENITHINRYEPIDESGSGGTSCTNETRSLREILESEFDCELTVIRTGGGDAHYAPREQRTDGTNVLTISPRKVIMYERNLKTQEELERHGVETLTIPGSELVRGLGGPRCMSMPLRRAANC